MDEKKIARINELYKKKKAGTLTEEEAKEQALLRAEYIESVRALPMCRFRKKMEVSIRSDRKKRLK